MRWRRHEARWGRGRGAGLFRRALALGLGLALFSLAGAPRDAGAAKKKGEAPPALSVSGSFAFEVAYDDNIIHYSDPDLYQFVKSLDTLLAGLDQKTTVILSTDSELFGHLKASGGR